MARDVDFEELQALRRSQRAVLVDVLPAASYDSAHIPGATNLPVEQIQQVHQLLQDSQHPIVVYCAGFE